MALYDDNINFAAGSQSLCCLGLSPARALTWQAACTKYLNYFSYGEAFLVEGYQNGARQHLALRQLLISLIPLRSVISRWVINESSADSVTNNSSYLFHETNSYNGRQG